MDRDIYNALSDTAHDCFVNHQIGLKSYEEAVNGEAKPSLGAARMQKYKDGRRFYITELEYDFHLIGFLDALAWMARNDYIDFKKVGEESNLSLVLGEDITDVERAVISCIITDAEMLEQFASDALTMD